LFGQQWGEIQSDIMQKTSSKAAETYHHTSLKALESVWQIQNKTLTLASRSY
jgi:hypothetical protein